MATTPAFERAADLLERETPFDRLAARGTVRLALRDAGLDARSVSAAQMLQVVQTRLGGELAARGVPDASAVCARIATGLAVLVRETAGGPEAGSAPSLFESEDLGKPR